VKRRGFAFALLVPALLFLAGGYALVERSGQHAELSSFEAVPTAKESELPELDTSGETESELVAPDGSPAALDCAEARLVVRDVRARFAAEPKRPLVPIFADLVASWLDPHGLWSAAADTPIAALIRVEADSLLDEIEASPGDPRTCAAANRIGGALERWVHELATEFDHAAADAPRLSPASATELTLLSAFEDGDVTVPARKLAAELGRRAGAAVGAFGVALEPFAHASRARYLPELDADGWARVVLAAALRGYVAAVDPHGGWVPLDEEWALYADDPSFDDADRLWGDMLRTALGVRIVDRPTPPLEVDDLVLAVDGVPTAGLSVEQVEQLARAVPVRGLLGVRSAVVLRAGEHTPRELVFEAPEIIDETQELLAPAPGEELDLEFVPYGRAQIAVVAVRFVGDDLGERLADVIAGLELEAEPPLALLLDLRGNGGGSTDGAAGALGVFLPGYPAFPLLRRGRVMEVLLAEPEPSARYEGPVAVLVDGETASAAEMLAGALDRYGRGVVIGSRTFGKGCMQEYSRDPSGAGVLRLTTRLFTLPDGSPVQRVGIVPRLALDTGDALEREADLPGAIDPVRGPDVRVDDGAGPPWPARRGRLGPCRDPLVCAAIGRLAQNPRAAARVDAGGRKRRTPR
jgi:carboxyl-terminal processing protease